MSDKANLLALAATVEAASADEQRDLLIEAFKAIHGPKPFRVPGGSPEWKAWLDLFNPFFKKLEARAFLDAALTLVPEGHHFGAGTDIPDGIGPDGWAWVSDKRDTFEIVRAATPALALTASALRAQAASQ